MRANKNTDTDSCNSDSSAPTPAESTIGDSTTPPLVSPRGTAHQTHPEHPMLLSEILQTVVEQYNPRSVTADAGSLQGTDSECQSESPFVIIDLLRKYEGRPEGKAPSWLKASQTATDGEAQWISVRDWEKFTSVIPMHDELLGVSLAGMMGEPWITGIELGLRDTENSNRPDDAVQMITALNILGAMHPGLNEARNKDELVNTLTRIQSAPPGSARTVTTHNDQSGPWNLNRTCEAVAAMNRSLVPYEMAIETCIESGLSFEEMWQAIKSDDKDKTSLLKSRLRRQEVSPRDQALADYMVSHKALSSAIMKVKKALRGEELIYPLAPDRSDEEKAQAMEAFYGSAQAMDALYGPGSPCDFM